MVAVVSTLTVTESTVESSSIFNSMLNAVADMSMHLDTESASLILKDPENNPVVSVKVMLIFLVIGEDTSIEKDSTG